MEFNRIKNSPLAPWLQFPPSVISGAWDLNWMFLIFQFGSIQHQWVQEILSSRNNSHITCFPRASPFRQQSWWRPDVPGWYCVWFPIYICLHCEAGPFRSVTEGSMLTDSVLFSKSFQRNGVQYDSSLEYSGTYPWSGINSGVLASDCHGGSPLSEGPEKLLG